MTNPVDQLKTYINTPPANWPETGFKLITHEACDDELQLGLHMAKALSVFTEDADTLITAFIFPTAKAKRIAFDTLEEQFGATCKNLIRGLMRMAQLEQQQSPHQQNQQRAEKLRKMLIAIVDDTRIILIKLIEQLCIMQQLRHSDPDTQQQAALPVRQIYAPLANRLGVGQLKWQLEDYAFRYLEPEAYQKISKALNMKREDREQFIQDMMTRLKSLMDNTHIKHYEVAGRAKHIYSIHRKLQRKTLSFEQLNDASALRVLVPSIADCYAVLGIVHATWPHIAHEFDDYIANPKANGYQSVHTAVQTENGITVEIQIRTFEMHQDAELGVAAHWAYKENTAAKTDQKANWLRQVLAWQQELGDDTQSTQSNDGFDQDYVYVFTPQGDIVDLPNGATPLDFAYHIHTNVGHRCRGASINGHIVPLTYTLKTGDTVSIQTAKIDHPSRDWVNPNSDYLKTHRAKQKVATYFRKERLQQDIQLGHTLWEKATRGHQISKEQLLQSCKRFHCKDVDELYANFGSGHLGPHTVLNAILQPEKVEKALPDLTKSMQTSTQSEASIEGVNGVHTQLAKCCKPIPGDAIIGYISSGRGIIIHKQSCHHISQLPEDKQVRLLDVRWGGKQQQHYPVEVLLQCGDAHRTLSALTQLLAQQKVPIANLHSQRHQKDDLTSLYLTIQVAHLEGLQQLLKQLQNLPSVRLVHRL